MVRNGQIIHSGATASYTLEHPGLFRIFSFFFRPALRDYFNAHVCAIVLSALKSITIHVYSFFFFFENEATPIVLSPFNIFL